MGVDSTTQAFLAALLGAVVAASAVIAWHISDSQQRRVPQVEEPVVPPEVATVLSVLRSSAVVVDDDDTVLKASAPAYALGLVRGTALVSAELADLVHQVRRDGQIRETELVMTRPGVPSRHVTARVAPLGSRLVLALVEDRTRERRVEAVRRDFVANVSHELKTPVGAIRVLAEAVSDAADDPEAVRRFAGRMENGKDGIPSQRFPSLVRAYQASLDELFDESDLQSPDEVRTVMIEKLPTFVGAGGGGTGEGEYQSIAFPRYLVEDELKIAPDELLAIEVEGDSMKPEFLPGDQLLVDKRKTSFAQPGAFCLWDGDGYVVKFLEKVHGTDPPKVRVISENKRYETSERLVEEVRVMGRIVWIGRRI